jgi:hypothetical protein
MGVTGWLKSERHRRLVERWWIAIVLCWDVLKSLLIDKAFAKYGVNPYVYFAIVISIAIPYAISTAKLLFSLIERYWRNSAIYGAIAVILHFIPDIYILETAKQVPRSLFDSFILLMTIFAILGTRQVIVEVRKSK